MVQGRPNVSVPLGYSRRHEKHGCLKLCHEESYHTGVLQMLNARLILSKFQVCTHTTGTHIVSKKSAEHKNNEGSDRVSA